MEVAVALEGLILYKNFFYVISRMLSIIYLLKGHTVQFPKIMYFYEMR